MKIIDSFKLNEIVSGLETVIHRNKHYNDKYLKGNEEIMKQDPELVQRINTVLNNPGQNTDDNPLREVIECLSAGNKIVFKYKLDKFLKYKNEHPDVIQTFLSDKTIELMSDCANEFRWISQWLIINIDTYMNMFFKIMFNSSKLPKGFKPKENYYKSFPLLEGMLDKELDSYDEMHLIRNNIVHNGMIADRDLSRKEIINIKNEETDVSMYIVFPKQIFDYTLSCLRIVQVSNDKILKDDYIAKELHNKMRDLRNLYKI